MQRQDVEQLTRLLTEHPDVIHARFPTHGGSLLHVACAAAAAAAPNAGAIVASVASEEGGGYDSSSISRSTTQERVVDLLLEHGADANARSANGSTPLHW